MAFIELSHLSKSYSKGSIRAVDDVSLHVRKGEFVVFVGSSGCGKSTTLRLIAGLENPDSGTISLAGSDITRTEPADRNVAMVFQDYALYPHMTVFDNIAFPLKVRKVPKDERERRVREISDLLGITELLDRKPPKLSGGQQQRVAIGRALVRNPSVFLMDEPLSNLDAKLRTQMRTELARIHRTTGATILYVTHDQTEAMTLATKIVVMDQGRVQQIGTPRELYNDPANLFVAGFIGSPSMNFLECRIERGMLAGFRPEHVSVEPAASYPSPSSHPNNHDNKQFAFIDGRFEREEIIGSDVFLIAEARGRSIIGKADMEAFGRFHAGQPVAIRLNLAAMLLFDADSGRRIRSNR